jgi:hypothetical protein
LPVELREPHGPVVVAEAVVAKDGLVRIRMAVSMTLKLLDQHRGYGWNLLAARNAYDKARA